MSLARSFLNAAIQAGGKAAALQDTLDELGKRFARKSGTAAAKPPANQ